jgi:hypothetical protein
MHKATIYCFDAEGYRPVITVVITEQWIDRIKQDVLLFLNIALSELRKQISREINRLPDPW